jgi:tetratricopeptide (TPR) repeat protein
LASLERPEILYAVLLTAEQHPVLLADLVFHPATSALACSLIAQWQSPSSGWDRELTTRDDQNTKAIAFVDAVSVMGHFLEVGSLRPEEVASLLDWMHKNARTGSNDSSGSSESMLAALRSEVGGQSTEILQKMVESLTASLPPSGLGTSKFAAALDIVDAGKLSGGIDPAPLVTAYTESVAAGEYTLSANRVSISGAISLLELARRSPSELFQKFLYPIDVKAKLADATGENEYTVKDNVIRAVRAHVRVLSRAVAGRIESGPDELVNALIAAVRAGALGHEEKGRVAAFSPRYETEPFRGPLDRPIAADLGAALSTLVGDDREQLLVAVLETDEPMVLAQLLAFAPHASRGRIEKRIKDLTPSQAGEIRSLTEAQERIEVLLSARLADAAAQFIEAERDLKPFGNPPGREMTRLRATLRLQLLRQEWAAIANTEPSPQLSPSEKSSAEEIISFYKALAVLQNPSGNRQAAEQMFTQLQRRRPDIPSYSINLFAAQISDLLGADLFAQLDGATLVRGRRILADAEQMMLGVRSIGASDTEIFTCNKALLLLALGQPEQAYELLASLQTTRLADSRAAYSAVALSRMGRAAEAMAMLDQAEQALGGTGVLQSARAHIKSGKAFLAIANVSSEDNPVPRIKAALFDLSQMDHIRQAEVLYSASEPFDNFVIEHVRSEAGSVTSLVPIMKEVKIDSCEDDLSALVRELLASRFQFLGWSVPDQSKGGFTAKGNPGERDLLLQKDTATLAVIEAVVCKESVAKQNLTSHFQKVLGYSTCRLFFHLTYAYSKNLSSILEHLRKTAEKDAPPEFKYLRREDISLTDSRPTGFVARYALRSDEVKVVFLVLDMGQHPQRDAAKTAAN